MERDGSFTHLAITAALSEQEMATLERRAEERACERRQMYLEEVKAETKKYNELTAKVNEELRAETEKFDTKQLYLNSLKQVNKALVKEAAELERQLAKERKTSATRKAETAALENCIDPLCREFNSATEKVKKAYGILSLEKEVAALEKECEEKEATIKRMDQKIREIKAEKANDLNQFIVKLAEVKVSTEASKRQLREATAEVERLEAVKRTLEEEQEQRAHSKSVAQVKALPPRHPTESPRRNPCAASSEREAPFHVETSTIPSTSELGSANQLSKQSKGFPSRIVAPSKLPGLQLPPQLLTGSAQLPEPSRPPAGSPQTPKPPQPSTSSARTPEQNRPSAHSSRLGSSEYFNTLRMKLPTAPSPKLSANKRPDLDISKLFFPPLPRKQQRMEGIANAVPTTPSVAPARPIISTPPAPGDKSAATPAPAASRSSVLGHQPTFFTAPQSAAPRTPQEGTSSTDSTKAHQGLKATTEPAPLVLAPLRPVRQHSSSICHDAKPDAQPRSFPPNSQAESSTSSQSAAPQPQGASDSEPAAGKHASSETPRGHDGATPPTSPAGTPSSPIRQHITTTHRDASQPPRSPFPPKYRAQTFAAPESTAPQLQGTSCAGLPVGRCPPTEGPRAHTTGTVPATLSTASPAPGHQYASSIRRDASPRAETIAARQGQASETQNSGPRVGTPVAVRVSADTAQGGERSNPFSSPPPRAFPTPRAVLPFGSPERGRPSAAQHTQPPSDQQAPEHGWAPGLPPAPQPSQSQLPSFPWSSPPPTQASEVDQGARPPRSETSPRGSQTQSEFSFGAPSSGGGGEDAFNLFGEDDDNAGGDAGFHFSLPGAGSNPPRFNF